MYTLGVQRSWACQSISLRGNSENLIDRESVRYRRMIRAPRRMRTVILLGILVWGTAVSGNVVVAQTRGTPESGLITWPEFPTGPIGMLSWSEDREPFLLTEISTANFFAYDPGLSASNRLMVADYELSRMRASIGWSPEGPLGTAAGRLEAYWSGRIMWGGVLDSVIETHHAVTGLPNNRRAQRPRGGSLLIIAPTPEEDIDYRQVDVDDDRTISEALVGSAGPLVAFSTGGSYSRAIFAPWIRGFTAISLSTLPRVVSSIEGGGAVTGIASGGVHLSKDLLPWLRVAIQGDVSLLAVAGSNGWRSLLGRRVVEGGAVRVDLVFGSVEVVSKMGVRRSPLTVDYYRFGEPAIGLDFAVSFPSIGQPERRWFLGFTQDFPPWYVAPDFGVTVGMVTPMSYHSETLTTNVR